MLRSLFNRSAAGILAVIFVTSAGPVAGAEIPAPAQKTAATGAVLLDQYLDAFQEMAMKGSGGLETVETRLQAMMAEARRAREEGTVTPVFFYRYNRLLAVTKLIMAPDKGGILVPVVNRTIEDFVWETSGESLPGDGGPAAVGAVANAIAEEIVNLQIYLDTLDRREAIRKKIEERTAGPGKGGPGVPADRPRPAETASAAFEGLRLHEELMLIALRDNQGTLASKAASKYALGGALLAELLMEKRIEVEADNRNLYAKLLDATPVGEPLLDDALARMERVKDRSKLRTWVERFAKLKDLERRAAEPLVSRGILRRVDSQGIFGTRTAYPEVDPEPERELIRRLEAAIFGDAAPLEPRTIILVSLAKSADLLPRVLDKSRLKARKDRLERIINGELAGRATREALQAMEAANFVTIFIIPAIVVTSSGQH